jgi:hypothetical protein
MQYIHLLPEISSKYITKGEERSPQATRSIITIKEEDRSTVDEDVDDGTDVPASLNKGEKRALRHRKLQLLRKFLNRNKLLLTSDQSVQ